MNMIAALLLMFLQVASCYAVSSSNDGLMENKYDSQLSAISPEHSAQEVDRFQRTVAVAADGFTQIFGTPAGQGYYFECVVGPLVQLNGVHGWWVYGLTGYCSQQSDVLGPVGTTDLQGTVSPICTGGYTGGSIKYGDLIEILSLTCTSPEYSIRLGEGWGQGEGPTETFSCPEGTVINGFGGTVGDKDKFNGYSFIESIYFKCQAMTASCRERKNAKFTIMRRRGDEYVEVTKTCGWLREQSPEKISKICSRGGQTANTVCKKTCGTCY